MMRSIPAFTNPSGDFIDDQIVIMTLACTAPAKGAGYACLTVNEATRKTRH